MASKNSHHDFMAEFAKQLKQTCTLFHPLPWKLFVSPTCSSFWSVRRFTSATSPSVTWVSFLSALSHTSFLANSLRKRYEVGPVGSYWTIRGLTNWAYFYCSMQMNRFFSHTKNQLFTVSWNSKACHSHAPGLYTYTSQFSRRSQNSGNAHIRQF